MNSLMYTADNSDNNGNMLRSHSVSRVPGQGGRAAVSLVELAQQKKGKWPVKLVLQHANDPRLLCESAAAINRLPSADAAAGKRVVSVLPQRLAILALGLCAVHKGAGGRQPGEDPALDPTKAPAEVKRILNQRRSAAASKVKKKAQSLVEELVAAGAARPRQPRISRLGGHHSNAAAAAHSSIMPTSFLLAGPEPTGFTVQLTAPGAFGSSIAAGGAHRSFSAPLDATYSADLGIDGPADPAYSGVQLQPPHSSWQQQQQQQNLQGQGPASKQMSQQLLQSARSLDAGFGLRNFETALAGHSLFAGQEVAAAAAPAAASGPVIATQLVVWQQQLLLLQHAKQQQQQRQTGSLSSSSSGLSCAAADGQSTSSATAEAGEVADTSAAVAAMFKEFGGLDAALNTAMPPGPPQQHLQQQQQQQQHADGWLPSLADLGAPDTPSMSTLWSGSPLLSPGWCGEVDVGMQQPQLQDEVPSPHLGSNGGALLAGLDAAVAVGAARTALLAAVQVPGRPATAATDAFNSSGIFRPTHAGHVNQQAVSDAGPGPSLQQVLLQQQQAQQVQQQQQGALCSLLCDTPVELTSRAFIRGYGMPPAVPYAAGSASPAPNRSPAFPLDHLAELRGGSALGGGCSSSDGGHVMQPVQRGFTAAEQFLGAGAANTQAMAATAGVPAAWNGTGTREARVGVSDRFQLQMQTLPQRTQQLQSALQSSLAAVATPAGTTSAAGAGMVPSAGVAPAAAGLAAAPAAGTDSAALGPGRAAAASAAGSAGLLGAFARSFTQPNFFALGAGGVPGSRSLQQQSAQAALSTDVALAALAPLLPATAAAAAAGGGGGPTQLGAAGEVVSALLSVLAADDRVAALVKQTLRQEELKRRLRDEQLFAMLHQALDQLTQPLPR